MDRALRAMVLGLLTCASCAPGPPATIQTDHTRYVLRPGPYGPQATIVARFTAPRDTTVYITHCNGAISWGVQQLVDGAWTNVWGAETNGCFSDPIVVQGGSSYSNSLVIVERSSMVPREEIAPGTYRVVWHGLIMSYDPNTRQMGEELPLERRVSRPIEIEKGSS